MNLEPIREELLLLEELGFYKAGTYWRQGGTSLVVEKGYDGWICVKGIVSRGAIYRCKTLGGLLAKGALKEWA